MNTWQIGRHRAGICKVSETYSRFERTCCRAQLRGKQSLLSSQFKPVSSQRQSRRVSVLVRAVFGHFDRRSIKLISLAQLKARWLGYSEVCSLFRNSFISDQCSLYKRTLAHNTYRWVPSTFFSVWLLRSMKSRAFLARNSGWTLQRKLCTEFPADASGNLALGTTCHSHAMHRAYSKQLMRYVWNSSALFLTCFSGHVAWTPVTWSSELSNGCASRVLCQQLLRLVRRSTSK